MRKFIISFAVMAISASVILSVNENRKLDSLIAVNAEALASGEVTLMGKCEDEMNDCIAICESCKRQFYAKDHTGGSYDVAMQCSECANKH